MSVEEPEPVPVADPVPESLPVKIKIQKRTPTERQIEALEKARLAKQRNKLKAEIQNETQASTPFLMPSPYLVGTIVLGLGGLVGYYLLKQGESSPTTVSYSQPTSVQQVQQVPPEPPKSNQPTPATQAFFNGSTKI